MFIPLNKSGKEWGSFLSTRHVYYTFLKLLEVLQHQFDEEDLFKLCFKNVLLPFSGLEKAILSLEADVIESMFSKTLVGFSTLLREVQCVGITQPCLIELCQKRFIVNLVDLLIESRTTKRGVNNPLVDTADTNVPRNMQDQ